MEDIILIGYGGHAKSVADSIERIGLYNIIGYTDSADNYAAYKYLGTDDVLPKYLEQGCNKLAICIGYLGKGNIREILFKKFKEQGFIFPAIIDPAAIVSKSAVIGEGTFVGKGAVINADAKIGKMCIINTGAVIEHECIVEDFTHVAVGAVLCGQVKVGRAAFIGANATVIQCLEVGEGNIVPAGHVVRIKAVNNANSEESLHVGKRFKNG